MGGCGSQAFSYTLAPSSSILIFAVTAVEVHTLICDAHTHLYVQFPQNHTLCYATGITHSLCRVVPGIKSATLQIKGSSSKDKSALHAWVWHLALQSMSPKNAMRTDLWTPLSMDTSPIKAKQSCSSSQSQIESWIPLKEPFNLE